MRASPLFATTAEKFEEHCVVWAARGVLRPIQLLIAAPSILFLAALAAMLLRPSDVRFYEIDRVAFAALLLAVVARSIVLRRSIVVLERASWPMMGLVLLALADVASQPFDYETWSLLASKLIVPFVLFHLASSVFTGERQLRQFELFSLMILAYLSFTAIAFLCGARWLIFPRFILDESLGIQADRARGPMLQAVANGVSLNLLGLLALHAYRRRLLRGPALAVLLPSVPIAILATMTRAVWLSFAGSVMVLIFFSNSRALRRVGITAVLVVVAGLAAVLSSSALRGSLGDRLEERGPVEFREAVYAGGWGMFLQRPWTGWGFHQMPSELPRFVSGYNQKQLYPHNTYLELLGEHGLLGLALYVWLMWEMWRLSRGKIPASERNGFLDSQFHRLWPILLAIYWVNAAVVVMSYQFVNGLLFAMAGMLAAQNRRAECHSSC